MTKLLRLEFVGGPLDGAVRPVPEECETMPLACGAAIHVYARDEVFFGPSARQIMRHYRIIQAWWREDARPNQQS
jgi:hypothetical protein